MFWICWDVQTTYLVFCADICICHIHLQKDTSFLATLVLSSFSVRQSFKASLLPLCFGLGGSKNIRCFIWELRITASFRWNCLHIWGELHRNIKDLYFDISHKCQAWKRKVWLSSVRDPWPLRASSRCSILIFFWGLTRAFMICMTEVWGSFACFTALRVKSSRVL